MMVSNFPGPLLVMRAVAGEFAARRSQARPGASRGERFRKSLPALAGMKRRTSRLSRQRARMIDAIGGLRASHGNRQLTARLLRFSRVGGPCTRRAVDMSVIRRSRRKRGLRHDALSGSRRDEDLSRDRMLGRIVVQWSDERRIDRQTRNRASMFNLHFDPSNDVRQSSQCHNETVLA